MIHHEMRSLKAARRAMRAVVVGCMLAGGCEQAPPGRHSAEASSSKTQAAVSAPAVALAAPRDPMQIAGDTLELVSYAGQALSGAATVGPPCDAAQTPLLQRFVFARDSYSGITVIRPGCRDPRVMSSDTMFHASTYSVTGDTLMIYTGDGDEVFQWINVRLLPDSAVPFPGNEARGSRFARRHGTPPRS